MLWQKLLASSGLNYWYVGSNTISTDLTTYDFGNFVIPADGLVVVGIAGRSTSGSRTISSLTVGGVAADERLDTGDGANANPSGFYTIAKTAGTHNITLTWSGAMNRAGCFVWLLQNYNSAVPTDTDGLNTSVSGTSVTVTLDISAGGAAFYCGMSGPNEDHTWSGATEREDVFTEVKFSAADKRTNTALTADAETVSWTTSGVRGFCGISIR